MAQLSQVLAHAIAGLLAGIDEPTEDIAQHLGVVEHLLVDVDGLLVTAYYEGVKAYLSFDKINLDPIQNKQPERDSKKGMNKQKPANTINEVRIVAGIVGKYDQRY
jgi:hypothetical protein